MKSQLLMLPRLLAALPELDFFNPGGEESLGGAGAPSSVFDEVNFRMFPDDPAKPDVDYTELHLDSPAAGGTNPIHASTETERCMLVFGLPGKNDNWEMALTLTSPEGTDTIGMSLADGDYATIKAEKSAVYTLLMDTEYFFTISPVAGQLETYVNINQPDSVALLSYSNLSVFDTYRVSLLALANTAG